MKRLVAIPLLLITLGSAAHDYDRDKPFETDAELVDWCRNESQAAFVGRGTTPFNWSASYWSEADVIFVKGSWRVDGKEATVKCSVGRGARRSYASMTIGPAK